MTYKTTTKKLKNKILYEKEMKTHYEELFKTSVSELKFERLRIEHYKSILEEVEVLLNKWVKNNLISKVIELWKTRDVLDISIHYDIECWWIKWFNDK